MAYFAILNYKKMFYDTKLFIIAIMFLILLAKMSIIYSILGHPSFKCMQMRHRHQLQYIRLSQESSSEFAFIIIETKCSHCEANSIQLCIIASLFHSLDNMIVVSP